MDKKKLSNESEANTMNTINKEKCPYCNSPKVIENSRGVWCENCEKDIYWNDLDKGY